MLLRKRANPSVCLSIPSFLCASVSASVRKMTDEGFHRPDFRSGLVVSDENHVNMLTSAHENGGNSFTICNRY